MIRGRPVFFTLSLRVRVFESSFIRYDFTDKRMIGFLHKLDMPNSGHSQSLFIRKAQKEIESFTLQVQNLK